MMATKRKRNTNSFSVSRKRSKAPGHPHGANVDPDKEYKLKSIVGENQTKYLISWEDDSDTGEAFPDTWEPKANANAEAVEDWENQKAEKRRLEGRIDQDNQSRSNSSSGTRVPKQRRKSATTPRKKKPRRVIDSSSQAPQSSQTNGHIDEHPTHHPAELIEIDESPAPSPPKLPATGSPLFEPEELAEEQDFSEQPAAAVHLSSPPSSYLAGGYQAVPSQFTSEPTEPQGTSETQETPEPSQYEPDPGDQSTTTVDTTEVFPPSTPTQQAQSVPVNFGESSTKIVPDSQTVPGSASYIPSATVTTPAFSAPETRHATQPNEEPAPSASGDDGTSTTSLEEPRPQHLGEISGSSAPEEAQAQDLPVFDGASVNPAPTTEEVIEANESGAVRAVGEEPSANQANEPLPEELLDSDPANTNKTAGKDPADDISDSQAPATQVPNIADVEGAADPSLVQIEEPQSSPVEFEIAPNGAFVTETSKLLSKGAEPPPVSRLEATSLPPPPTSQAPIESPSKSTSQQDTDSEDIGIEPNESETAEPSRAEIEPQQSDSTNSVRTEENSASSAHVDLTRTQIQPDLTGISVTPPQQRPVSFFSNRRIQQRQLDSSTWQSSPFPFETQLPRSQAAESAHSNPASPSSNLQRQQPLVGRTPPHETSPYLPGGFSQPLAPQSVLYSPNSVQQASSQPVGVYSVGESGPPPPLVPSSLIRPPSQDSTMEQSQPPSELVERLRAIREAEWAKRNARRNATPSSAPSNEAPKNTSPTTTTKPEVAPVIQLPATRELASPFLMPNDRVRSPSVVPALEPLTKPTKDEMNTSRRVETLLPQSRNATEQAERNGSLTESGILQVHKPIEQNPEEASVHVVPIYLIGHQRDQYLQVIYHHRSLIDEYLGLDAPDGLMVRDAKHFVERVRRVAMHPDLDNAETSYTQYDVPPSQQAKWDVDCSAKFRFLKGLLDFVRNQKLHVILVARPGRIIDILENFLRGIKVVYRRIGVANPVRRDDANGDVRVSLLSTDTDAKIEQADLVIAMDNSVKYNTENIKTARLAGGKWSPFITLVVPQSVEHIERSLSTTLSDRAKTRALVSGVKQFWNKAGTSLDSVPVPKDTARLVAQYVTSNEQGADWPLPPLPVLEDLDSQTESEVDTAGDIADGSGLVVPGEKRSREDDDDTTESDPKKRSRVESPVAGDVPDAPTKTQELDTTHISDSIAKATQEAELSSPHLTPNEKRLQDLLIAAQDRADEYVKDLGDVQYRHEEERRKLVEMTANRDNAVDTAQRAIARLGEESNKLSNQRSEITSLKEQLKEANEKLLSHSVPERAEWESMRLQLVQAAADKEKAEKRVEQANKDVAYVRELYQNSSTSAQALSVQVSELENQLAVSANKASGEQAKLRSLSHDNYTKNLQDENKKLKMMLKERDAGLKFRDEEIAKLKEASRGRMGTRGTSVPRSPRMGSPRVGSRQTSPAAGELRGRNALLHPLRNAES